MVALLAQRYTAVSPGSAGWMLRVEEELSDLTAENRLLGIPDVSTGSLFRKYIRNFGPCPSICWYQ